ncbi:GTP cyclohydrolase FolE2 [Coralloluteibacterium thermophilus]|uniref:GTP cyclohydrolase FolE2 n=1 Tax=Coralloluteibacterium thermophilum TaxID=2707049 RepID=A0ABV9NIU4_9GAMM
MDHPVPDPGFPGPALPDVARTTPAPHRVALDWVGMSRIEVPLRFGAADGGGHGVASVDLMVDLPDPDCRGIHMSRLYRLLTEATDAAAWTPAWLLDLLRRCVDSHADCGTRHARLAAHSTWMTTRRALETPGLAGWRAYPVRLGATWVERAPVAWLEVEVAYASTCPCSAALSRAALRDAFLARFGDRGDLPVEDAARWLSEHGSIATPHSQRSVARVRVPVDPGAPAFGIPALAARIEDALGTPVQAAVKRADEQAFARRNGGNLMYVEDAARRIRSALREACPGASVHVRHQESLHPHDAVALVADAV